MFIFMITSLLQKYRLIVDYCKVAEIIENINSTYEDRSACEVDMQTASDYFLLNVNTPLQLGGRRTNPNYPPDITLEGFNGCIKNLRHNGKVSHMTLDSVTGDLEWYPSA